MCVVNIVAIFTDQKAFGAKLGISRCVAVSIPLYQVVSDIADCVLPLVDIGCPKFNFRFTSGLIQFLRV